MEPSLSDHRVAQLTRSLMADAHLTRQGVTRHAHQLDQLDDVLSTYGAMSEKAERTPGYPRLYRQAWVLLIRALRGTHWHTLDDIDTVFQSVFPGQLGRDTEEALLTQQRSDPISVWHLKSVLYAWSRTGPSGSVRHNRREADALLSLISISRAFINMSPDEASAKLIKAALDQNGDARPYLFRVSTTEPGAISLSFITPVSNRVFHHRLRTTDMVTRYAQSTDLYATLVEELLGTAADLDDTALLIILRKIDPYAQPHQRIEPRWTARDQVYSVLRRLFFPHTATQQLIPESARDRSGITDSYRDSYVSLSSSFTTLYCFNSECDATELTHQEPLSHRMYCSRGECYQLDYTKCY